MSLREFAKRVNVSPPSVCRAIRSGRLQQSIVHVDGVPTIVDAHLAEVEWRQNLLTPAQYGQRGALRRRMGALLTGGAIVIPVAIAVDVSWVAAQAERLQEPPETIAAELIALGTARLYAAIHGMPGVSIVPSKERSS